MSNHFDLIVAGGGMAGVAAAVAAGRHGAKTLLIESGCACGGMGSSGLVPCFTPFSYKKEPIVGGIAAEMHKRLQDLHGSNHASWAYLDAEAVKFVCDELLESAGVQVAYLTTVTGVEAEGRYIKSITVYDRSGFHTLTAGNFIDATGDAAVAYMAGVPAVCGDACSRTQPGSCCMVVAGINARALPPIGTAVSDDVCSITNFLRKYTAEYLADGRLVNQENFEYHIPGAHLDIVSGIARINFGHFYHLGCCDPAKLSKLLQEGRKYARLYVDCLKKNMPGMENAVLVGTPSLPNIRESRRIVGRTVLPKEAYWNGERHPDDIAIYDYMIDVHALDISEQNESLAEELHEKLCAQSMSHFYGIPFSIMLPEDIDNLAVAGRCVSADQAMLGSLRVMPAVLAMGQAAGTAAAMSQPLSKVNVRELQKKLLADNTIMDYPYC